MPTKCMLRMNWTSNDLIGFTNPIRKCIENDQRTRFIEFADIVWFADIGIIWFWKMPNYLFTSIFTLHLINLIIYSILFNSILKFITNEISVFCTENLLEKNRTKQNFSTFYSTAISNFFLVNKDIFQNKLN